MTDHALIAYGGDRDRAAMLRARVLHHRRLDRIVQGTGYQGGHGCAIGCTLEDYDPAAYARVLGVQLQVAHLVDAIHECLPLELAVDWPARILHALEPGRSTALVWERWALWMLTDPAHGVARHAKGDGLAAVEQVAGLYRRAIAGDAPRDAEWDAAAVAADAAHVAGQPVVAYAVAQAAAAGMASDAAAARAMDAARTMDAAAWVCSLATGEATAIDEAFVAAAADKLERLLGGKADD